MGTSLQQLRGDELRDSIGETQSLRTPSTSLAMPSLGILLAFLGTRSDSVKRPRVLAQ